MEISTSFGRRLVVRRVGRYIQTAPRVAAPNGEWWFLSKGYEYMPVASNSPGVLAALAAAG